MGSLAGSHGKVITLDLYFCIADELDWFQDQGGREVIQLLKVPLESEGRASRAAIRERN